MDTANAGNSGSPKGPNAAGCCSSRTEQDRGQHTQSLLLLPSSGASCFLMTSFSDHSSSGSQILGLSSPGLAGSETQARLTLNT